MSRLGRAFGMLWTFADNGSGSTTAEEYSLFVSGIAVAIIVAVFSLGGDVSAMYGGGAIDVDSAL